MTKSRQPARRFVRAVDGTTGIHPCRIVPSLCVPLTVSGTVALHRCISKCTMALVVLPTILDYPSHVGFGALTRQML